MRDHTNNVRNWASELDHQTRLQAERTARVPVMAGPVALMPDAHIGIGATVGSVIATDSAIIPAAVGVDIGCGMIAQRTNLDASDLPDDLDRLLGPIHRAVPAGLGRWNAEPKVAAGRWLQANPMPDTKVRKPGRAAVQLGTLGGGNHFAEICLDEADHVWFVLHSGSRGIGNQLAQVHIGRARDICNEPLEDPDLAWLAQGTPEFEQYVRAMLWAQDYAAFNRVLMLDAFVGVVADAVGRAPSTVTHGQAPVNCHHNYATLESHGGREVWVTRKGAIRAGRDDWGVIPGSMGQSSYIVRGLGSPDSYESASHGAGRVLSRGRARRELDADRAFDGLDGVAWQRRDASKLIDEAPAAYKDINQVMDDQRDLVEVRATLRAILNYKGTA